jgi:hypothetical protein
MNCLKGETFTWTKEAEKAFKQIKTVMNQDKHELQLIPKSIKGRNIDIKPHQCIPEWPDDSQHAFHRL